MQIFISWSGDRSRLIAEAIRGWLPKVVQSVKPWMSDQDISAGARWLTEVSTTLNNTTVGLICVTPENQQNPWLLFEAGALSKTIEQTSVCPLVFQMTPGQLTGPLTQFQANSLDREGIGRVLSTVNKSLGDRRIGPQELEEILDVWWPKLLERLETIPAAPAIPANRSTGDQLEELLALAREQLRRENIRLEASIERDEKLDMMLEFIGKAGATIGALQGQSHRINSALTKAAELASTSPQLMLTGDSAQVVEIANVVRNLVAPGGPGTLDSASMRQMTEMLRGMQERDK